MKKPLVIDAMSHALWGEEMVSRAATIVAQHNEAWLRLDMAWAEAKAKRSGKTPDEINLARLDAEEARVRLRMAELMYEQAQSVRDTLIELQGVTPEAPIAFN